MTEKPETGAPAPANNPKDGAAAKPDGKDAQAQDKAQARPPLLIQAQYIKDLSYETPNAPEIYVELRTQPNVTISVDVKARKLKEDNTYEVSLHFNIEGKGEAKTAFLMELEYGCVCTLSVAPEHVQPMLLIEAPRMLFPFARSIIADITRDGGFPPLMLSPIDFVGLYRQRVEQAAAQQQQAQQDLDGGQKPPQT